MKAILKATAVLGSASVVNILTGLVSAKVSALLLGPSGLGFGGLMLSLLAMAGMIAGMGVSVGLVRQGARALADDNLREMAAVRSAAWLLCITVGGGTACVMVVARVPISALMLGGAEHASAVVITAIGLLLNLSAGVQTGILNAYQRVGALARGSMLSSAIGVTISLAIIWRWRSDGITLSILVTCLIPWMISLYILQKSHLSSDIKATKSEIISATARLLKFGAPFTASLLVGAGVIAFLPVIILHELGETTAGYYRAASAIAVTYLGFITVSMGQDYYPRVSAADGDKDVLIKLINEQHYILLLIVGPIILGMLALVPYAVPLLYSQKFTPSVELLEWQLLSDIFRFSSWTMAFVILANGGSFVFFLLELFGGITMLTLSWLGMRWFGLSGLGMGFLACSILYYSLCWIILHKQIGLRWTRKNITLLITLIILGIIVRALPQIGLERARNPIALSLAVIMGLYTIYALGKEIGGYGEVLAFVRRRGRRAPSQPIAIETM